MFNDTLLAFLISFVVCVILCPLMIPILHRLKFGQNVRTDGPQTHLVKSGTPTMGGIMILLSAFMGGIVFVHKYPMILPVLLFMTGFGIVGFLDDYLKIRKKKSDGLSPMQKLLLQLLMTGAFAMYLYLKPDFSKEILIPLTGHFKSGIFWNLGWLFIPFVFLAVLGTDNGVNFTDGLDGLCASVTIAVLVFFIVIALKENIMIAPAAGAVCGSLLGFLVYNVHPAQVFMGDTGSLGLGGFVASLAILMQLPLFLIIIGGIYFVEVLSVMIQVGYFKKTGGKRFFKMAPIHHHFEIIGWSETKVVAIFTIVTILLSIISYLGMRY